ncbi:MAG: Stk1 family PASTA domain-containing Ser/Thr kinase [Jatrophihabitantaceae bacterium]
MHTVTADPLVGRRLEGRYRILERIARGGMSTVYSAVDERLDRHVAVKVMSGALSADPAFSDRFAREARAAARLTHLNAVAVYDQGIDTGPDGRHVFLVMELVAGRTLRDLIRERGAFSPAEAISVMEPVLSALSAAHHAGLVHRDVKPENILLSDGGIVKVADFGLARAIEADAESTRTGLMMGTVAYCSPEQITRGHADPRSDVYAAGIVLFELLSGRTPFQGESAMNVAYQHVHSRVPAPSSKAPKSSGIASEIDELVIDATDSDPSGRPADAGEFLARIAELRAELALPVVPLPVVPLPPRMREARRGRPDAGPGPGSDTTELFDDTGRFARHDTQVVAARPFDTRTRAFGTERRADEPPPPVVIPPSTRRPRPQRSERHRRRRRGLVVLILIVLLGLAGGFGAWWYAAGRYSRIPDVRGQSLTTATTALQSAGYRLGSVASSFSETVPKDEIVGTTPGIGARVVRGDAVALTVSLGKDRIPVPQVAAMSPANAQATLQRGGVTTSTPVARSSDTVKKGLVIGTVPAVGTKIKRSDPVQILVSSGPPVLAVPSIAVGTPFDQAAATLKNAHFAVAKIEQYADSVPAGGVISLDPSGQQVKFGTVTVTVSKGPQFVTLPSIPIGTPFAQAKAQLLKLGLTVVRHAHFGAPLNEVFGMSPSSGQVVRVGSPVTLDVV